MKKSILIAFGAALLIASCSKSETPAPMQGNPPAKTNREPAHPTHRFERRSGDTLVRRVQDSTRPVKYAMPGVLF